MCWSGVWDIHLAQPRQAQSQSQLQQEQKEKENEIPEQKAKKQQKKAEMIEKDGKQSGLKNDNNNKEMVPMTQTTRANGHVEEKNCNQNSNIGDNNNKNNNTIENKDENDSNNDSENEAGIVGVEKFDKSNTFAKNQFDTTTENVDVNVTHSIHNHLFQGKYNVV